MSCKPKIIVTVSTRFLLLCILLHLPTQLEDRFTLPIFLILFPVAIYQFAMWVKTQDYNKILLFSIYFVFMYLFHLILLILSPVDIEVIRAIHKYIRLLLF